MDITPNEKNIQSPAEMPSTTLASSMCDINHSILYRLIQTARNSIIGFAKVFDNNRLKAVN